MPKTLPGFLMLAGLALFVLSYLRDGVRTKWVTLRLDSKRRRTFRILGVVLILASAAIYLLIPAAKIPQLESPERTSHTV